MAQQERTYICIDLKSFYASVECIERGLDPMNTNLVVADNSRTEKTICLAVSPSLKSFGIPGRPRLFEVIQKVKEINAQRKWNAPKHNLTGSSYYGSELKSNPSLAVDYIVAPPQMAKYVQVSADIYGIYLKYIMPEDIHVYSIDEVFIDATHYLTSYKKTAREFITDIMKEVLFTIGITATVGIGTNMYLAKVAMDILAKKMPPNEDGVRIAELNEMSYRRKLWEHTPLTDFWRIGNGYSRKLESHGLLTMGDIARCSIGKSTDFYNEDLLYKMFGVNAELLIDHAWGWEPCTIQQVKEYKPESKSIGSGQVLHSPYTFEKAKIVMKEMIDSLIFDLIEKELVTNQIVITIGYDRENLNDEEKLRNYKGALKKDHYGRNVPKHAHGTVNIDRYTSSTRLITDAVIKQYDKIVDRDLLVRRLSIAATRVISEDSANNLISNEQLDLFTDYTLKDTQTKVEEEKLKKERSIQKALLSIKKKYGKNAIMKGMDYLEGATALDRNNQIGGHRAGS